MGRAPRTYDAGLDKVNLQLDRGFVTVNEWMETSVPGVYAIGDIVAGLPQLAHVGAMAGIVVASKLAGKYARAVRKDRVPGCTYCDPQIASVGLTEAQAKEKGYQVKVGKFPFVGNSKATIVDAHDGFVKIVSDAKYGEILGVHIIGPQATELIAEAVTAMELEATVEEMMFTIHAHPTLYESLLDGFCERGEHGDQRLTEFINTKRAASGRLVFRAGCHEPGTTSSASTVHRSHRDRKSAQGRGRLEHPRPAQGCAGVHASTAAGETAPSFLPGATRSSRS